MSDRIDDSLKQKPGPLRLLVLLDGIPVSLGGSRRHRRCRSATRHGIYIQTPPSPAPRSNHLPDGFEICSLRTSPRTGFNRAPIPFHPFIPPSSSATMELNLYQLLLILPAIIHTTQAGMAATHQTHVGSRFEFEHGREQPNANMPTQPQHSPRPHPPRGTRRPLAFHTTVVDVQHPLRVVRHSHEDVPGRPDGHSTHSTVEVAGPGPREVITHYAAMHTTHVSVPTRSTQVIVGPAQWRNNIDGPVRRHLISVIHRPDPFVRDRVSHSRGAGSGSGREQLAGGGPVRRRSRSLSNEAATPRSDQRHSGAGEEEFSYLQAAATGTRTATHRSGTTAVPQPIGQQLIPSSSQPALQLTSGAATSSSRRAPRQPTNIQSLPTRIPQQPSERLSGRDSARASAQSSEQPSERPAERRSARPSERSAESSARRAAQRAARQAAESAPQSAPQRALRQASEQLPQPPSL